MESSPAGLNAFSVTGRRVSQVFVDRAVVDVGNYLVFDCQQG